MRTGKLPSKGVARAASFFLLAALAAGCSTVSVDHKREVFEGKLIPGTECYDLEIGRLNRTPLGKVENVTVQPAAITKHYQVEQWERTWDMVSRKRYVAVLGCHPEYSFGYDLLMEPVSTAIPVLPLIGFFELFSDEPVKGLGMITSCLPFICLPYDQRGSIYETVRKHENLREIEPVPKTISADATHIPERELRWTATRSSDAVEVDSGKIKWPSPTIEVPWTKWVLAAPTNRAFNFSFVSNSKDLMLVGSHTFPVEVDLEDAVKRAWPNPEDYPSARLSITAANLCDEKGQPAEVLQAGFNAKLRIHVKNSGLLGVFGAPVYLLRATLQGDVPPLEVSSHERPLLLEKGSEMDLYLPVSLPLQSPDGKISCAVVVSDVLGRSAPAFPLTIPCRHTELPVLQIFSAVLKPGSAEAAGSTHQLEICIRNAGKGTAYHVATTLSELPPGFTLKGTPDEISALPALGRTTLKIPVAIAGAPEAAPLIIELAEQWKVKPVRQFLQVPVLPP